MLSGFCHNHCTFGGAGVMLLRGAGTGTGNSYDVRGPMLGSQLCGWQLAHVISEMHHMTYLTTGPVYSDMRVDIKQVNKTAAYIQASTPTHH